jgi:hypothetical protein
MRKLILILLAFIAVFTYIRASDKAEAQGNDGKPASETSAVISAEFIIELPVEIIQ